MSSVFQELERRNVFRVAVVHAVMAWLVIRAADVANRVVRLSDRMAALLHSP